MKKGKKTYPTRKSLDPGKGIMKIYEEIKFKYHYSSSKEFLETVINNLAVHPQRDGILEEILKKAE